MAAPIHTPAQRVSLRRAIAQRMLQGFTQAEIALDLGISAPLVKYYYRQESARWLKEAAASMAEHKAQLSARYDLIYETAMADYLESGAEKEATTTRQRRRGLQTGHADVAVDQTTEATKRVQQGRRNPAFLDTAIRALDRKAELYGLKQPASTPNQPMLIREIALPAPTLPEQHRLVILGGPPPSLPPAYEPDEETG